VKNFYIIFVIALLLYSCKSVDYPSIEESQNVINLNRKKIDSLNQIVNKIKPQVNSENDLGIKISLSALNKIVQPLANSKDEDINCTFYETKPLLKEDKSILGISYSNYLNIDKGFFSINLKKFYFDKLFDNKINAILELEGKGNISVSGKYMGLPGSISPLVELYLYEPIAFNLNPANSSELLLNPEPKTLLLKTKTSLKFFEWYIPWYYEIPLQLSDLIPPVKFPIGIKAEILFPLPSSKNSNEKIEYYPYQISLDKSKLYFQNNQIEYITNLNFNKK